MPRTWATGGPLARAVAAAVLVLVFVSAGFAQELSPELAASFEEGIQALGAGKLDEAESAFRAVLEQGGNVAQVHHNLGIVHQRRGQHERAIAEFRTAADLDPTHAATRILLGTSLLALGRVAEATTCLEAAVELAPRETLARRQLAAAYEQGGDWGGAVDQLRVLRELSPKEPEYIYRLGRAYLRLSEQSLEKLRDLDPDSARSQQALGHSYRVQGRPDLALLAFGRAARADPTLPEIHLAMAQIYMEQKRWAEARREIELELALVPESAGARALALHLRAAEAASR
jgi:tetratricopeptide (TPR) repeat protein